MNPFQMLEQNLPQYDQNKMKEMLPKLDANTLEQAKNMAKMLGISETQINQGLEEIQKMKNQFNPS